jgi:hypothetical protein
LAQTATDFSLIYALTKAYYDHTIKRELEADPRLKKQLSVITYEKIFGRKSLPTGTYIFTDLERLDAEDTEKAAILWHTLNSRSDIQVLNDPVRSMRRFELLRTLYARGINSFNVYRVTDAERPGRFPVFVRSEDDHQGSATHLLNTAEELDAALASMANAGLRRENKIIVEFCDVADEEGVYHWCSAFRIGPKTYPSNHSFLRKWMSKDHADLLKEPAHAIANEKYLQENPHSQQLMEIFELAGIQYGRIDYALLDGKIQVFEINTNPVALEAKRLGDALDIIQTPSKGRVAIRIPRRIINPTVGALRAKRNLLLPSVLNALGLRRFEKRIIDLGRPIVRFFRSRD